MKPILIEAAAVFALLQLLFGYTEYKYKGDIFYVAGRLLTSKKYLIPGIILPLAYILIRLLMNFLFAAN